MKRLIIKVGLASVSVIAALLITLLVAVSLIIFTQSGTQFAWQQAQPFLPDTVKVELLTGRLAGPLNISGLKVRTEAFDLELDKLEFGWQPSRLFKLVLDIDRLIVTGLRFTQLETATPKTEEEQQPFTLPEQIELPFNVRLGLVSLNEFEFRSQRDAEPFVIHSAQLTAAAGQQKIDILSLNVKSPVISLEGKANLTTAKEYPLTGELRWQLPVPEYPTVSGLTQLTGSLQELSINQTIEKPYDVQAQVLLKNPLNNLSFEADINIHPLNLQSLNADLPAITAQLALKGSGAPDDIALHFTGWAEDQALGRLNAALAGGYTPQAVSIDDLTITVPEQPAQLKASGKIELTDEPKLNVQMDWLKLQWPLTGNPLITSPSGKVKLTGTIENLIAGLDIAVGDNGNITGKAQRENEGVAISLNWHELQWPLTQPEVKSPKGHVSVTGKINDYILDLQAGVVVPEQTDAQLLIQGHGSEEDLTLSRIAISALEGTINGKADVRWKPELKGSVDLAGQGLNPGVLIQDWPGKLTVKLQAQGGIDNEKQHLQLQQLQAQGQLRGYELSLDAKGTYTEELTVLEQLALSSGSTQLTADGTISDTLDVNWQVHSKDLGTLLPEAEGRIDGKGIVTGSMQRPQFIAGLNAEDLAYPGYYLKSLNLDADVDLTGEKQSKLTLQIENGNAAGVELHKIYLNGLGDPGRHSFTLTADTSKGQADIALQGELLNPWQEDMAWDFTLNTLQLKYPALEGWALQMPATGRISSGQAQLSQSCLQSREAVLCLNGSQSTEELKADFTLTELPFNYLAPFLPADIDVQGNISGKGSFHKSGSQEPSAAIDFQTSTVRLLTHEPNEEELNEKLILTFLPGEINLNMQDDGIRAGMKLPLSETDGIAMQATIAPDQRPLTERQLTGQVKVDIEDLDFIADLIPDVQQLAGRLNGDMTLSGSPGSPVLRGKLALIDGAAQLERPGLNLSEVRLELTGEGDGGLKLTAHALSEGGELNITGTADLKGDAPVADITIKGDTFRIINTQQAEVDASPDLTIAMRENQINVDGEVVIPHAQIKLKTLPESAVKTSDDQVIAGSEEPGNADKNRDIYARVRVILGDTVSFDGFGLNARIKGNILAVEKPGEPTTGSGEMMVLDGEYRAYGQGLVIEKGRILFAGGPISQPGLDVRAVRRPASGITVGVQVRGNIKQPDFTLFSDPSMTQGNQLSYLVLGRPMSGSSSNEEGSALSRAALALGLKGGSSVAAKINSKLGFDQFGIASTEAGAENNAENASFVIGKYLSPKLYISYGLGVFDPVSTLRLQYTINKRWEFVTESSDSGSGGDINYTIETGN